MAKKLFKGIYRTIEFILGFLIILILLLLIRLWSGPIEIKNLSPIIVGALANNEKDVQVDMQNAYMELALSRGRLIDIRLTELSVSDNDGFVLSVEQANIAFNPLWLLVGRVVVRDVDLYKPYIQMDLTASGKANEKPTRPLGRQLNRVRRYMERLDELKIKQAEMALKIKPDASILLPDLNVQLERHFGDEFDISLDGQFYFDGVFMDWGLSGEYDLDTKKLYYKIFINDVDLSKTHSLISQLSGVDLTLDVKVKGQLDLSHLKEGWRHAFEPANFEITTQKAGTLYLPKPLDTTYRIQNAKIKGQVQGELTQIDLKDSQVEILDKTALLNAQVSNLPAFFETKDFSKINTSLTAKIDDIPVDKVPELWPSFLGTDAHQWIAQNVTGGMIKTATLQMNMSGVNVDKLTSVLDIQNATVRYVDEMIPASDVHAIVTLEMDSAKIEVVSGKVGQVQATGGYVNFLDLDKDIPLFDMEVTFKGAIKDGLNVVSGEPLQVCETMSFSCSAIKGNATGNVRLSFPFLDDEDALVNAIQYTVNADLEDAGLPVPKTDWHISDGAFKLSVDNEKLTLDGDGLLDEKPMTLNVVRYLDDDRYADSLYSVHSPVTASMVTPYFEQADNFFQGTLLTDIVIKPVTNTKSTVDISVNLKDAEISLPIGYVKELEKEGVLKATLSIENDKLVAIPNVSLSVADENISIKGRVDLPKDKVFAINLPEIKAPRTDAAMTLSYFKDGRFDATINGKSVDVSDLVHGDFFKVKRSPEQVKNFEQPQVQNFSIQAKVNTLYLSSAEPFTDVVVNLKKQDGHWSVIDGSLTGKVPFTFSLNPSQTALTVQTQDVGEFLRRAGYTDRIKGGVLDSTFAQAPDGSLSGEINVQNYELTKTNFFMQAATLLGIVDALRGDTIYFDKAVIPFTLSPLNVLTIQDAVASGAAVGITVRGTVDSDVINLEGSVVPAYALNSLFGKIPLLGTLLSGEKGGGLFGVSYSVTGGTDDPQISFNPVSILAPGIFRRLF